VALGPRAVLGQGAAGINLIDLAPRYGDGKAETVVGEAFAGRLPEGVRVTSKCNLGNAPPAEIEPLLRRSIEGSLKRLRLASLASRLHDFTDGFGPPPRMAQCALGQTSLHAFDLSP
jgi:diketogulonate reductase-like aldo/keto reductase